MKRSPKAYDFLKRAADVVFSLVLLVVLSPVLLAVGLLVRIKLGSPIIFTQHRPGLGGKLFTIYKFRTMSDAPAGTSTVAAVDTDGARLTRLGRTLRATSLDELPELWNVLRGDMSFVGPRPLLPEYLERYNARQARRHEVRPGITGLAQVSGRNALSWEERFDLDVYYVDHRSLALDLRVVAGTIGTVLSRSGVSAEGHATVEPFDPARENRTSSEENT